MLLVFCGCCVLFLFLFVFVVVVVLFSFFGGWGRRGVMQFSPVEGSVCLCIAP